MKNNKGEGRGGEGRGGLLAFFPEKKGGLIRERGFIEDLQYLFKHHPKLHPEWIKILTFRTKHTG